MLRLFNNLLKYYLQITPVRCSLELNSAKVFSGPAIFANKNLCTRRFKCPAYITPPCNTKIFNIFITMQTQCLNRRTLLCNLNRMIAGNVQESRRDRILKAFDRAGKYNPLNEGHQLWQNGNYQVVLFTPAVIEQKIDSIHENPVRAGFVGPAHEYWHSEREHFLQKNF